MKIKTWQERYEAIPVLERTTDGMLMAMENEIKDLRAAQSRAELRPAYTTISYSPKRMLWENVCPLREHPLTRKPEQEKP